MPEPKTKKRRTKYNPAEEAKLENLIFGDSKDVIKKLDKDDSDAEDFDLDELKIKKEKIKIELNNKVDSVGSDDDEDDEDFKVKFAPNDDDDDDDEDEEEEEEEKVEDNDSEEDGEVKSTSGKEDNTSNLRADDSDHQDDSDLDEQDSKDSVKPVWFDEDDNKYSVEDAFKMRNKKLTHEQPVENYNELLKNKFINLIGTPNWAKLDKKDEDDGDLSDSDYELMKHSKHKVASKSKKLIPGKIEMKRMKDINKQTHNEGEIITSLQFHPTSTVALVAGLSGILSIFQVDGRENTKLHSLKFDKFRIDRSRFLKEGNQIILGAKRNNYCQLYDLILDKVLKVQMPEQITNTQNFEVSPNEKMIGVLGRRGEIFMLSAGSKELIHMFKMNENVKSIAFTPDNNHLISVGETSEMYIWDLNNRTCLSKVIDDGCINGDAVTVSKNGQFLATGSREGVVNIYDLKSVLNTRSPKPLKTILNLVTSINKLKFNPTSEILAICSTSADNGFKMVHLPSYTVFSNFPTFDTVLSKPNDIDFSPGSGYLGISNNRNNAFLYRLKHYGNY